MAARDRFRALRTRISAALDEDEDTAERDTSTRLARFNGATVDHPVLFGGGHAVAAVDLRSPTTAFGYPAVVEEYEAVDPVTEGRSGVCWTILQVSLPNVVPALVVDHRAAEGRPNVPGGAFVRETGDDEFDLDYIASADDPQNVTALLTAEVRSALVQQPVQRIAFAGATLLIRTVDGVHATPEVIRLMCSLAGQVLAHTPAFASLIDGGRPLPFPRGLSGPAD